MRVGRDSNASQTVQESVTRSAHRGLGGKSPSRRHAPAKARNLDVLPGIVADIGPHDGPVVEIRLDCSGEALIARLTRHSVERLPLARGAPDFALVKSVAIDRRRLSGPIGAVSERRDEVSDM